MPTVADPEVPDASLIPASRSRTPVSSEAAESAPRASLLSALDAVAPPADKNVIRLHVRTAAGRGRMIEQFGEGTEPGELVARAEQEGPGEYEFCVVRDNQYTGDNRRFVVKAPSATASPAAQVPAAAAPDVRGLVEGFSATVKEMLAGMMSMMEKRDQAAAMERREAAIAAKEQQLEMLRELNRGQAPAKLDGVIETLVKRALEPPPVPAPPPPPPTLADQLRDFAMMKKLIDQGGSEEGTMEQLAKGALPVLAGIVAAAQQQQPKPAAPTVRRVVTVGKPGGAIPMPPPPDEPAASSTATAGDAVPAAKAEPTDMEKFEQLVGVIEGMARRNVAADAAMVALSALLPEEDFSQVATLVTLPGALDQLLMLAPKLAPYRAWLEALAAELGADPGPVPSEGQGGEV